MEKSLSFTGHRLHKLQFMLECNGVSLNDRLRFFDIVKTLLYIKINHYIDNGFKRFYIGMSDGIDLWAGQILLELKSCQYPELEIVAVQPFYHHGRYFSDDDRRIYNNVLKKSNNVVCLNYKQSKWSYFQRNRYIVDNSTNLLAFVIDHNSGTGYTINYAESLNKSVEVVNLTKLYNERVKRLKGINT